MPRPIADAASEQAAADAAVNKMRRERGAKAGDPNTPEENKAASDAIMEDRRQKEAETQKAIGISGFFGRGVGDSSSY